MNIFRLLGDISHVIAIIILLQKIWKSRSCSGISGKSQILFAIVFSTRYLDIFFTYVSLYNTCMKIMFIVTAYATIYLIFKKFRASYDTENDTFRVEFIIIPVFGLAMLVNHEFTIIEILWTFSIYLESLAILPQLFVITRTGEAETITSHYLFALGSYRGLYILNWIYRYFIDSYFDWIAICAGTVQTLLYADFFYLYFTKVFKGKTLRLPTTVQED